MCDSVLGAKPQPINSVHMGLNAMPGHICVLGDTLEWIRACSKGLKKVMTREEALALAANHLPPNAQFFDGGRLDQYLSDSWPTKVGVLLSREGTTMTILLRGWDDNEEKYYLFTRTY